MTWRYIAQRISGPSAGTFLDWNVPLTNVTLTQALGSDWLSAEINPAWSGGGVASDGFPLLDKWSVAVWAEQDGVIQGGGILVDSNFTDSTRKLECMGYGGYPSGIPYGGEYSQIGVEPLNVVRHIWQHLQSQRNGNLGVVVDSTTTTPVRMGTPKSQGSNTGPYELMWWEAPDCGEVIQQLAADTPFEYRVLHAWNSTKTALTHRLVFGYPRLGRRRTDLRFMLGENLEQVPDFTENGTDFANEVLALGSGSGRAMVRHRRPSTDHRLRRVAVVSDKSITTAERISGLSATEQRLRSGGVVASSVSVLDHPNAQVGSWQPGDEVLLQARTTWGDFNIWCRVISTTIDPAQSGRATLALERSA